MKKIFVLLVFIFTIFLISFVSAQTNSSLQTVCCERTVDNLYCQSVPSSECAPGSQQAPTACESTSFCRPGVCYETKEGICLENTPLAVCNSNNSKWSETAPAACGLGCCVLGDQAAFVSLVRCKRLASDLGIPINYNKNIQSEVECVLSVQNQDKGACVYEFEFEKTCKFTTRSECNSDVGGAGKGEFYANKLCSAPELETNCAKTTNTECLSGKEGVYFVDSCGNPANIYDSSKVNDLEYWTNVKTIDDSCNPASANFNSKSCGNCNYLLGSICRESSTGNRATYGDNICTNLNCVDTKGNQRKHGESWCVFDDSGETGDSKNSVGSRFYKHICINGEETVEACDDFRQAECIEDKIVTDSGIEFSQAACRVNRWKDCLEQTNNIDCGNEDRRDCNWIPGRALNGEAEESGTCVPENPPGLQFWDSTGSAELCQQANTQCVVKFEKGLIGGDEKCVENCDCLTDTWVKQQIALCTALGDCGENVNWVNDKSLKPGYKLLNS